MQNFHSCTETCFKFSYWGSGDRKVHVCDSKLMETRAQLSGVSSLLPPSHGFQELNSSIQAFVASTFTCSADLPAQGISLKLHIPRNWVLSFSSNRQLEKTRLVIFFSLCGPGSGKVLLWHGSISKQLHFPLNQSEATSIFSHLH